MGGKRRAPPSGSAEGKAAAIGDGAVAQGGSRKRQTRGLSVGDGAGSAEAGSRGQEDSGSTWVPVTISFSIRCDPSTLAGLEAQPAYLGLQASLREAATNFGGRDFRLEGTRVGPSNDILQRVLPLLLEHVELEGAAQFSQVCKLWKREMKARAFCSRTVQLCSALAGRGNAGRLMQNAMQRAHASSGEAMQEWKDASSFLARSAKWKGNLHECLQAASQEPDTSFLSRGAASTAQCLGLRLVRWVGKPQGGDEDESGRLVPEDGVTCLAFSPDGKRVVCGYGDKLVRIWNAETSAEVRTMKGHASAVTSIAFSSDGTRIVGGYFDGLAKVWDAATGAEVCTLAGHVEDVDSVAFSSDGKRVISECLNIVKIWNADTGAEVCSLLDDDFMVLAGAFSLDGKRVVAGAGRRLKIYNAETGAEMRSLEGHAGMVTAIAFSLDGKRVVSGGYDRAVKIWNAETGAEMCSLGGHSGKGICLCPLGEDGHIENNADGSTSFHPGCPAPGHTGEVNQVLFTDDGAHVVSGDDDVRVWDVASGRQVCHLAGTKFVKFALVEGASDENKRARHVLTADGDTLRIYEIAKEQQPAEDGAAAAPVACFKAPQRIHSVRCHGAAIWVACAGGVLCILSAPFLTA